MCDGRSVKNSIDSDTEYAHTSMTIRTFDIDSLSNCYLAPLLENEITLRRVSLSSYSTVVLQQDMNRRGSCLSLHQLEASAGC